MLHCELCGEDMERNAYVDEVYVCEDCDKELCLECFEKHKEDGDCDE